MSKDKVIPIEQEYIEQDYIETQIDILENTVNTQSSILKKK